MNPQRAAKIIPPEAVVTAETRVDYMGSAWVIWARWQDGMIPFQRPVTQFATGDPFSAAHWIAQFNNLRRAS